MCPDRFVFFVAGEPVGKGRPRVSCVHNRPRVYTPAKTRYYEERVHRAARRANIPQIETELAVDVIAVFKRPKRLLRKKDPDGLLWRPQKPDGDNIRKAVLDGLSRFFDDKQVVSGDTLNLFGTKECEQGYTVVQIRTKLVEPARVLSKLGLLTAVGSVPRL